MQIATDILKITGYGFEFEASGHFAIMALLLAITVMIFRQR